MRKLKKSFEIIGKSKFENAMDMNIGMPSIGLPTSIPGADMMGSVKIPGMK